MPDLQTRVTEMTRRLIGGPARSAVVAIDVRGHGSAAAAAGSARHDTGAPMRIATQFHIASVAKPMTAVLIFQAAEEGLLGRAGIDARLIDTGALPPDICRRLARKDGVSYGEAITLRHLLTHTAGLRDAQIDDGETTSEGYGSRPAPNSIVGCRAADFQRHIEAVAAGRAPPPGLRTLKHWLPWDPSRPDDADAGLVNFYLNTCGDHALWPSGEAFHYSDTAFTILALVAEKLLGASYHRLLRARIFDPLGMHDSFLEAHSDLDPAPWVREVSDCWAGEAPLVSYGVTLSNDWGGGGVVATAADHAGPSVPACRDARGDAALAGAAGAAGALYRGRPWRVHVPHAGRACVDRPFRRLGRPHAGDARRRADAERHRQHARRPARLDRRNRRRGAAGNVACRRKSSPTRHSAPRA
jgi:CubicO group peptidase (beta-lactamase class C family)